MRRGNPHHRHCERSEAIQTISAETASIVSSRSLSSGARSRGRLTPRNDDAVSAKDAVPPHARRKSRPPARGLDFLFQEAMRFLADIACPRKSPGAAFVVGGAGGPAFLVALGAL